MYKQALVISILLVFSFGCSHTRTVREPSAVNQLRIKVAKMEKKLKISEEESTSLKEEVASLESRLLDLESYDVAAATVDYDTSSDYDASSSDVSTDYSNIEIPSKYKDIIRVSASTTDIQKALKNAGYYNGKIDGKFGARSKSAIYAFQKDHDLSSDGVIGKQTWSELKNYLN